VKAMSVERAVDRLNGLLVFAAGSALFGLMLLTFVDVLGRKFFRSVPGALEVSEMLMVIVLFCALPLVSWRSEHVGFELADAFYKGRLAVWSRMLMDLVCAVTFALLGLACWRYAGRTLDDGDVSVYLRIPIGWFVYLMATTVLLAGLLHLLRCLTIDRRA